MKTQPIILFLCMIAFQLHAQVQGVLLYDENGREINEDRFNDALRTEKYTFIEHASENDFKFQLILKHRKGKLGRNEWLSMRAYLKLNTIKNDMNVIVYYLGGEYCREDSNPILDKRVKKRLNAHGGDTNFHYVYFDSTSEPLPSEKKVEWVEDYTKFFKQNFLNYYHPCKNLLIVDYNGNYIAVHGVYHEKEIENYMNELIAARK